MLATVSLPPPDAPCLHCPPRGVDLLGNALLCALHRDHIPAANARVVHLSCVAFRLDGSDARLEASPSGMLPCNSMTVHMHVRVLGFVSVSLIATVSSAGPSRVGSSTLCAALISA